MDLALIANVLLCFGALGINIALGGGDEDDQPENDQESDEQTSEHPDQPINVEEAIAADRDMLAWFLQGGDDGPDETAQQDAVILGSNVDSIPAGSTGQSNPLVDEDLDRTSDDSADPMTEHADPDDPFSDDEVEMRAGVPDAEYVSGIETGTPVSKGDGDAALDPNQSGTGWDASEIFHLTDFDPQDDRIEIHYSPRFDENTGLEIPPVLQIADAPDGQSALITLDGTVVGQIDGATDLDTSHVSLVPESEDDADPQPWAAADDETGTDLSDDEVAGMQAESDRDNETSDQTMRGVWPEDGLTDGSQIVEITDYSAETDRLELHYTPTFDDTGAEIPPMVTVESDEFWAVSTILLDGEPVAFLTGDANLRASDIALVRTDD